MKEPTMNDIIKLVQLQLGKQSVSENDKLVQDLGAESADIANIVAVVEERYQITFRESEIAKIFTPWDIYNLVKLKLHE